MSHSKLISIFLGCKSLEVDRYPSKKSRQTNSSHFQDSFFAIAIGSSAPSLNTHCRLTHTGTCLGSVDLPVRQGNAIPHRPSRWRTSFRGEERKAHAVGGASGVWVSRLLIDQKLLGCLFLAIKNLWFLEVNTEHL